MGTNITPRALLMNDLHVSPSNIPEFTANWNEAISICLKNKIENIIIGGDLFQSRASQTLDVLLAVKDCMIAAQMAYIQVVLMNGNHDKVNQESNEGYCHLFDEYENVSVIDDYWTCILSPDSLSPNENDEFVLHLLAYFPEKGSFMDKYNDLCAAINFDDGKEHILYIHEGINGALAQPSDKELPAAIFNDFDRVLVGHYHNRCNIPDTDIYYIGSSRQHNFGEDEEKGYTILNSNGSITFIQNQVNIRFKVLDVTYAELNEKLYGTLEDYAANPRIKVKLKIRCTPEEAVLIDKQKLLQYGANKVDILAEDTVQMESSKSSLFVKFNKHEIKKSYEDFCTEKSVQNIALGMSYLTAID